MSEAPPFQDRRGKIDGTVFFSDILNFARRVESLGPDDVVALLNTHFYDVTEAVLEFDGIPIKYIGDAFLAVFLGEKMRERAVRASLAAKAASSEVFTVGLNSGPLYMGAIGHPGYARTDIVGDAVNLAARLTSWAGRETESGIAATEFVVCDLLDRLEVGRTAEVPIKSRTETVKLYELKGLQEG